MAAPTPDWTLVAVRDKVRGLGGKPAAGVVRFRPMGVQVFVSKSTKATVVARELVAVLQPGGVYEINLPATDDPDIHAAGFLTENEASEWWYQVTEEFVGGGGRGTYRLDVPQAMQPGGIDVSTFLDL